MHRCTTIVPTMVEPFGGLEDLIREAVLWLLTDNSLYCCLTFIILLGLQMVMCCCWILIVWQFVITLFTPGKSRARQALAFLNCVWLLWSAHTTWLLIRAYESRNFHWMRCLDLECLKSLTKVDYLSYNSASGVPINPLLWVLHLFSSSAHAKLLQLAWHTDLVLITCVILWYSLVVLCSVHSDDSHMPPTMHSLRPAPQRCTYLL